MMNRRVAGVDDGGPAYGADLSAPGPFTRDRNPRGELRASSVLSTCTIRPNDVQDLDAVEKPPGKHEALLVEFDCRARPDGGVTLLI